MNIEYNGSFAKIEVKKDYTLQEYSDKIDYLLEQKSSDMDKSTIDIIDKLPIRILIPNGNRISNQSIFLILNRNPIYIISVNSKAIYLSEIKKEVEVIKENTINIFFPSKVYIINQYIHDVNRSTKNFKFYNSLFLSSQIFSMDKKTAISIVKSVLHNLSEIECVKDIINLEEIRKYLDIIKK